MLVASPTHLRAADFAILKNSRKHVAFGIRRLAFWPSSIISYCVILGKSFNFCGTQLPQLGSGKIMYTS